MSHLCLETSVAGTTAVTALAGEVDLAGRFALVPGAAQVMRVFETTRMRERFELVDDPGELTGGS